MNENTTTCTRDGRPVADGAYCCAACVGQTGDNLKFIEEIADDLETTLTRQDRVSAGTGGRANAETPLPINLNASDVGARLRNTLTTWVRLVAEERGVTIADAFDTCGGDGTWCMHERCRAIRLGGDAAISNGAMAAWLRTRIGWIAHREWGPSCFDELSRVAVDLGRAVDSPPPMISLGRCEAEDCNRELRAHKEAAWVRCVCGESYDVHKLKDKLLSRADLRKFNAAKIARILTALGDKDHEGKPIVRDLKWVSNRVQWKQLLPAGEEAGHRTYRLGDARRLHDEAVQKDLQAAERKAARLESQAA